MKWCPILTRFSRGLIRSGYAQAAHELDRHGMREEAAKLRKEACNV